MKEIYALGVGRATPVFIELAESCGYRVVGLYHYDDSRTGEMDHGFPILGSFDDLFNSDVSGRNFVLTMGNMKIKQDVSSRLIQMGGVTPTLIHPTAIISRFSMISQSGVLVCSYSEIHSDSMIEQGCVLWSNVIIEHGCQIHEYVFFGPKAYVGAYTEIEERAFIGQCSVLISEKAKHIGKNTLIGAGSLVTKSMPDEIVAAGSPARVLRER